MKIGRVMDLLKVEFPALLISKVRHLEGEGLINSHHAGNGYRCYSQADLERLRYALAVQRDRYLPLHITRERLARLDADVEAPAPQPVARMVARDNRAIDDSPMDLEALLAHSDISEFQIEELVAVGLISPDVRGRYSQQNLRTVRLAMEITHKGVPLCNLRAVRASTEREADTINQAVAPRQSHSRSADEETARELAELVADLHTILLRRAVGALGWGQAHARPVSVQPAGDACR